MSRGMLDDSDWDQCGQEFPDLSKLGKLVVPLSTPDFLSIPFLHNKAYLSWFPVASVCLSDAYETLWGAHYALCEITAHNIWYLKKKSPPDESVAALFGRFYADDAALRLYSAGEHLANGIIMMLEISDDELRKYRKGKRVSQQSIVGYYLRKEMANHPITKAVDMLADSKEWQATVAYRNKWVHDQPPTVKGLGIVYKRRRRIRWEPAPTGGYVLRGGGDKPEYSVDEIVQFIKPAMFQFIETFISVAGFYKDAVESGIQTFNGLSSLKIRLS